MPKVAIYLRKSREDERLEKELGKGETLSLHRKDLIKYANANKLDIAKIYEELVSGESLLYRPAMLELLKEVELGLYDGVLCMDMQRLGRGDMEEQGIILKAFKKSGTKIITPDKTYDLDNEFDEEYSEFEAFMSRKEYKMINKRLRRGVLRSVESGNYNSPWRPFGYDIKELKDGRTLEINETEANIVKLVYNWYTEESIGSQKISDKLNALGIKTVRGNSWSAYSVAELIKNPVYTGKIAYNRRYGYRNNNKKKATKNRPKEEWLIFNGKHEAIISQSTYDKALTIMSMHRKSPAKQTTELVNPLAGLIECGVCGSKMVQRSYNTTGVLPHIMCRKKCGNKSVKLLHLENAILEQLKTILYNKKVAPISVDKFGNSSKSTNKINIKVLERQLDEITKQKEKAYDFLEKGIYSIEIFKERQLQLNNRTSNIELEIKKLIKSQEDLIINNDINLSNKPLESFFDIYSLATAFEKNILLKTIIEKAVYIKEQNQKEDNFSLIIFTNI